MLSFFSKKKPSPETPPGEITMKGPSEGNGEEFIIVENQHPGGPPPPFHNPTPMMPLYPYPPTSFGLPPSNNNPSNSMQNNPVPYIMGIPFNLSPQLCTKTSFEVTQMEVDGILALMTKQMQLESDYDFKLERGILSEECY
ncbi:uncharacterized protein LOC129905585 [Episyrphus balteatus]|uniref:uncharacterized protein LOC129905585 n=1 Tax=Episyrphus balteatus TaxID=286459 RepID=UPI002485FE0E|nr:uncharacterized protein LOC129905585 [Episyrphus balteatus]